METEERQEIKSMQERVKALEELGVFVAYLVDHPFATDGEWLSHVRGSLTQDMYEGEGKIDLLMQWMLHMFADAILELPGATMFLLNAMEQRGISFDDMYDSERFAVPADMAAAFLFYYLYDGVLYNNSSARGEHDDNAKKL